MIYPSILTTARGCKRAETSGRSLGVTIRNASARPSKCVASVVFAFAAVYELSSRDDSLSFKHHRIVAAPPIEERTAILAGTVALQRPAESDLGFSGGQGARSGDGRLWALMPSPCRSFTRPIPRP